MRLLATRPVMAVALMIFAAIVSSCGNSGTADSSTVSAPSEASPPKQVAALDPPAAPFVPPAVSIGDSGTDLAANPEAEDADEEEGQTPAVPEPDSGTPEWLIREITRLKTAPLDRIRQPLADKPGEFEEVTLTPDQSAREEVRRATRIVELALEVCAKTRGDAAREQVFNNAVHHLASARRTLAMAGDREQAKLLADEAETLYQLNAKSFAAVEIQLQVVEMLQQLAEQQGRSEPEWGQAAARQARLFASRFPQETTRGAMTLLTAAKACESAGLFSDARECFLTLEKDYGKTPFAEHAAGALRRYRLTGKSLDEFAGATIDGAFLSIDQFRGQPVLIVFWSTESRDFQQDLPRLKASIESFGDQPLTILGVNLDQDEAIVDSYLVQADLPWRTIFFSNPAQRGIRNPLARAYGVTTSPQYWVVDAKGVVTASPTDIAGAEEALKALLPK